MRWLVFLVVAVVVLVVLVCWWARVVEPWLFAPRGPAVPRAARVSARGPVRQHALPVGEVIEVRWREGP